MKTAMLGIVVATVLAAGLPAHAGGGRHNDGRHANLVGTWEVKLTPYVCSTGVPVPNATFDYMISFHEGGTLSEASSNTSFQPGQRTSGQGQWERSGRGQYASSAKAFVLFTSVVTPPAVPRYTRGAQHIDWTITMTGEDGFESIGPVTFTDETGAVIPPTGCVRGVGTRL